MQKLTLYEDIFDALALGKRTTIRKGRRNIELGELLFESTEAKRQKVVEVINVYCVSLDKVELADLKNDGFKDHQDMWEQMQRFYPGIGLKDLVTVVIFNV